MGRTSIGLLCLCLTCAIYTSTSQLVNVAPGKNYSQSSTYTEYTNPPRQAANGNTGGVYNKSNCIHTAWEEFSPWWQVDLRRNYPVSNITLWARNGFIDRVYPLNITVDGQLCVRAYSDHDRRQSVKCTSPIYGQVVRLTRDYREKKYYHFFNLCEVQIWVCPDGYYGDQCNLTCSSKKPRCSQCFQDSGQCTACRDNFKPPLCTACKDKYYKSGSTCTPCSSNCLNRQCDPDSGVCNTCKDKYYKSGSTCTPCSSNCLNRQCDPDSGVCNTCKDKYYKSGSTCTPCSSNCLNRQCDPDSGVCDNCTESYHGDQCYFPCSTLAEGCVQCTQGGNCTERVDEEKEGLFGLAVVAAGAGAGLAASVLLTIAIVMIVLCCRRKRNRSAGHTTAFEMTSSAPADCLGDSAITGSDPVPGVPNTEGVYQNVTALVGDSDDGPAVLAARPLSTSAAVVEGIYENVVPPNYDRLCPVSRDSLDTDLYTVIADVTQH